MSLTNRAASRVVWGAAAVTSLSSLLAGRIERFAAGYFDEGIYRMLAHNLIADGYFGYAPGRNVALRPPGYPLFVAGIRWVVDSQWAVRAVQALLAGATVLLAAWIARRLFDAAAAAVAAALLAGTGVLAAYAGFELSEALATFL
ncbi:MAG: glycosyltransferase family 39 protein, partial [Actinomycetota bacterium]